MPKAPSFSTPKDQAPVPESYESALGEIEELVAQMESGQLPLEKLLTSYKRGAFLLKFCREQLEAVEDQIKLLEDGDLKPWTAAP
jgi:exodeoxyribonuclease VII small subunit